MKIAAIAHTLPSRKVENGELIERILSRNRNSLNRVSRDHLTRTLSEYFDGIGLISRYHRAKGEKACALALCAVQKALERASVRPEEIDLLIYVGVGRGWIEPAMANLFIAEAGLCNATGFDIVDACASWIRAIDIAHCLLGAGRYRRIVILNGEFNFREYVDMRIPDANSLEYLLPGFTIGEAATATVLTDECSSDGYHALLSTSAQFHDLCKIPLPNEAEYLTDGQVPRRRDLRFYAYGTVLTQTTMRRLLSCYRGDRRLQSFSPDICFGHSVSEPITTHMEHALGLRRGITYRIFPRYGNTVSASIPLAMSLASEEGVLRRGQKAMLVVGSAGISVGFVTLTY